MHTPEKVLEIIINAAKVCGVEPSDLLSKCRKRIYVTPRQMAIHRIYELTRCMPKPTRYTLHKIGQMVGGRDYTTVIHSLANVRSFLATYDDYARIYADLCKATSHISFETPKAEPTFLERVNMLPPEAKQEIENYLNKLQA